MRKGFTLAEVLITIGITGVIAAMTIPNLITNIRYRQIRTHFKKSLSEWNQAAMLFMEDHDESVPSYANSNGNTAMINELPKYISGFMKYSDWRYDGGTAYPYTVKNLKGQVQGGFACDTTGLYTNLAGSIMSFDDTPRAGFNGPRMCIDINGTGKPNVLGIDIFNFVFTTDGHVIPEGQHHKDNNYTASWNAGGTKRAEYSYCSGGSTIASFTCAYYAFLNISPAGNGNYWDNFIIDKKF